ncbi:MAG: serine/threonine protein phosphatase PrpC [Lentisphaeria bacterium]|jgi:serine/threonine protein phosphatase PrpC
MPFTRYSSATDVGLQRNNNEDSYLSRPELGIWVVADGMGGHAAGEVASAIVSQTIVQKIAEGHTLVEGVQCSHRDVLDAARNIEGSMGMGSTVVALRAKGQQFEIAWVGDSRAYFWSPGADKPLRQITTDHSYVQMLYQTGAISEEELDTHPEKNIITQCLGSIELDSVNVDSIKGQWNSHDWILLCSDGLSDAVPVDVIAAILASAANVQTATKNLIDSALAYGGRDNITVSIIEFPGSNRNFLQVFTSVISNIFK